MIGLIYVYIFRGEFRGKKCVDIKLLINSVKRLLGFNFFFVVLNGFVVCLSN